MPGFCAGLPCRVAAPGLPPPPAPWRAGGAAARALASGGAATFASASSALALFCFTTSPEISPLFHDLGASGGACGTRRAGRAAGVSGSARRPERTEQVASGGREGSAPR